MTAEHDPNLADAHTVQPSLAGRKALVTGGFLIQTLKFRLHFPRKYQTIID